MHPEARMWIERLGLSPHPEGGFFVETYRSSDIIPAAVLPQRFAGPRSLATSIYFLLAGDDFSAFHRLLSDEVWHFYAGAGLSLYQISDSGHLTEHRMGNVASLDQHPQVTVLGRTWLAARPVEATSYALVGCTTSPGFDFADFELGERSMLVARYPLHSALIKALTRTP